jgi:hypothetical protein
MFSYAFPSSDASGAWLAPKKTRLGLRQAIARRAMTDTIPGIPPAAAVATDAGRV